MKHRQSNLRGFFVLAVAAAGLLGWPARAVAQTAGGEAKAVQATVFGVTTVLSDTGVLAAGSSDALDASSPTGSVPSLLSSDTLHAATVGSPDQVDSEASLGSLEMSLFGNTLSADFVMARAMAVTGAAGAATSEIDGLTINGVSIPVSGAPNQTDRRRDGHPQRAADGIGRRGRQRAARDRHRPGGRRGRVGDRRDSSVELVAAAAAPPPGAVT